MLLLSKYQKNIAFIMFSVVVMVKVSFKVPLSVVASQKTWPLYVTTVGIECSLQKQTLRVSNVYFKIFVMHVSKGFEPKLKNL